MDKINDAYLYDRQLKVIKSKMQKENEKIFILQQKEVISYDFVVMGAKTRQEAIDLFNESHGEAYDEEKENGEIFNVWKLEDSWCFHGDKKPTVKHTLKIKKCSLNLNYDCQGIVDHDENVCKSCLRKARIDAGVPCDKYGEPLEGDE